MAKRSIVAGLLIVTQLFVTCPAFANGSSDAYGKNYYRAKIRQLQKRAQSTRSYGGGALGLGFSGAAVSSALYVLGEDSYRSRRYWRSGENFISAAIVGAVLSLGTLAVGAWNEHEASQLDQQVSDVKIARAKFLDSRSSSAQSCPIITSTRANTLN